MSINAASRLPSQKALKGIPSSQIDEVWEHVEPYLQRVVDRPEMGGHYAVEDIHRLLKTRDLQLWLVPGGVWVSRVVRYPRRVVLELMLVAGEFDDWTRYLDDLMDWGRYLDCDQLECAGRAGWTRKAGLPVAYTAYRVDL